MLVTINIENGLMKFYNGDRYDLAAIFKADPGVPVDFTSKNPNSLIMMVFHKLLLRITVLNNLATKLAVESETFDMFDVRYDSKVDPEYRKFFGSYVSKNYNPDEDTTQENGDIDAKATDISQYEIDLNKTVNKVAKQVEIRNTVKEEEEKIYSHKRD